MKAKMKGVIGAIKPTTQNQACMWSEPDIVGWLDKRGGKFTSWKKRFFVLQGPYLFYFEDDFKVQAKNPLGVIPLDACKVDMKTESGDASRKYSFNICLGQQFLGYSKRDTYVIAAPSRQAQEEWVQRIETAAETREGLLDQLRKARWRGGDLRELLANSMGSREVLEYGASYPEGQALMAETMNVQQEIVNLEQNVIRLESQANHEEGALMRAMVVWDILNHYLTGKLQASEHSAAQKRIAIEKQDVQQLYRMFQMKGNFLQGQDIEYLGKEAKEKLKLKVEHSLYLIQERQAKIRSKAPRYSFNLNPNIFEDEGESLQQEFQVDTEGSQPAVLRFYKNIRAEVLETAEQLKNLKTTALRVAGMEGRGEERLNRAASSQDNEKIYDNSMLTNSNMLNDMMRKRGDPARDFSVEDTSGNQMVEGTTKAWLQNQQNQIARPQTAGSWPQQNQVRGVRPESLGQARPSLESFGPPQFGMPHGASQFSQTLGPSQSQMPLGRPFPGMQRSPESFAPMQSPTSYGTTFSGPIPQNNAKPMNQPLAMRPSNQPNIAAGSPGPSFSPRGFQQQMSSMPQPPAPNWPAQRPISQSIMPRGNFTQMPAQTMGSSEQIGFNTTGMMSPPSSNRQGPGLSSPASQVPSRFAMQRMHAPSPTGASDPQQVIQAFPQAAGMFSQMQQQMMRPQADARPQSSSMPQAAGMFSQMQQQTMRPQLDLRPRSSSMPLLQGRMPPRMMIQQNFPRSPQVASAQQNFPRPPTLPMGAAQQTFTRPPQMGLAPQIFNRPPLHDATRPRMTALQLRPLGNPPQRPM